MIDKSHVGMSNCYVCGEPSSVLLDMRLQNTLERNPRKKRRVFPYPARADALIPWIKLSVLDHVLEGGADKWLVGPVMFAEVQARNQLLTHLTGTPIEEILAAAEKAGPGVDTDATTLRKGADQSEEP